MSENFFENPCVLEFILNIFSVYRIFKKIALKTLWAERRQHAKREEKKITERKRKHVMPPKASNF